MNLTEQKNQTIERKKNIEKRLVTMFKQIIVDEKSRFQDDRGRVFSLFAFANDGAIGVEYAENMNDAILNRFEDGDLFYLDDMNEEMMFQAMIDEINS